MIPPAEIIEFMSVDMEVKYEENGKVDGKDATVNGDKLENGGHELSIY